MQFVIIISLFLLILIIISLLFILFPKKYKEHKVQELIPDFKKELESFFIVYDEFQRTFYSGCYITKSKMVFLKKYIQDLIIKADEMKQYSKYIYDKNILDWLDTIYKFASQIELKVQNVNDNYYEKSLNKYAYLFESIEKYPLDVLQQKAILTPEKYLLVIAWAGSWKTSTIVGKVKYLIEVEKAKPDEILLISFTAASAKEMNTRIQEKLGLSLDVKTFHKLWLDIVRSKREIKQTILDENKISDFREYISKELVPEIILNSVELFMQFFHYLLKDDKDNILDFPSFEDYKKYIGSSLEVVENISILWEKMKSAEEVSIANFLFVNSIKYKYESNYEVATANAEFIQYKPDFFLPEHNIYIEHFWIDRNGNVPKFFWNGSKESYEMEKKKYLEWIEWKKELHKKHNTKLITTYSYEHYENTLFEKLKQSLLDQKVVFKTISSEEIKEKISDKIKTESSVFNSLVLTFLSLYKSNNLSLEKISQKQQLIFTTKYKKLKSEVFIKIFTLVIERYKNFLNENNAIDFHDMINNATDLVQSESVKTPYKYIIIDEFQDIWLWRYNLIKSILDKNDASLFCVWDDWQSIYRFSGWDLNIFTHFEQYFPFWEKVFINKTYRYPQAVNNITHSFITKNKAQINKILESGNTNMSDDVYQIIYYANQSEKQKIVYDLKKQYTNIVWLGRTKSDGNICKDIMNFKTVHSAKWLEEDYVVLLNGNSGTTGFPIEIRDSFLLNLVLSESDGYDYSEERRLFYVALTRARKKTFILTQIGKKSIFVKELEEILWIKETHENQDREICPLCKVWILVMWDKYKKWALTCNLYPDCKGVILTIMPFWKYKWQLFSQIPKSYLSWLKNEVSWDDTKIEILDTIHFEMMTRNKKSNSM